jgi:hypothetical protein
MFQYAAGRALAIRSGADLVLDLSGFKDYALRHYELADFSIRATVVGEVGGAKSSTLIASPLARIWSKFKRSAGLEVDRLMPIYAEPHFHFDSTVSSLKAPVHLKGYWQSERYFDDIADVLRREFSAPSGPDSENQQLQNQIDAVNAISLHVRRGDYVSNPTTNKYHGTCTIDYYREALNLMRSRVGDPKLFVFSDEVDWARTNLDFDLPTVFVTANNSGRGYRDMLLMARCRHHILANSSFSWWGAWLNPSKAKIVIAPRNWFASEDICTKDLIPESWIRI